MAEVVTQEQYEQIKDYYREQKGYEDMSDDEKNEFDTNLDKAMSDLYEVDASESDDDQTDNAEKGEKKMELSETEMDKVKGNLRERYGYDDMSDEDKATFDEQLEQYCDDNFDVVEDDKEQDKVEEDENAKVKKLIR